MKIKTLLLRNLPVAFTSLLSKESAQAIQKKYAVYFEEGSSSIHGEKMNDQFLKDVLGVLEEDLDDELDPRLRLEAEIVIYGIKELSTMQIEASDLQVEGKSEKGEESAHNKSDASVQLIEKQITKGGVAAINTFFANTNFESPLNNPASPGKLLRYVFAKEYSKCINKITPLDLLFKNKLDTFQSYYLPKNSNQATENDLLKIFNSYQEGAQYDNVLDLAQKLQATATQLNDSTQPDLLRRNMLAALFYKKSNLIEFFEKSEDAQELQQSLNVSNMEALEAHMLRFTEKTDQEQLQHGLSLLISNEQLDEYFDSVLFNNIKITMEDKLIAVIDNVQLKSVFESLEAIEEFFEIIKKKTALSIKGPEADKFWQTLQVRMGLRIIYSDLTKHYCTNMENLTRFMSLFNKLNPEAIALLQEMIGGQSRVEKMSLHSGKSEESSSDTDETEDEHEAATIVKKDNNAHLVARLLEMALKQLDGKFFPTIKEIGVYLTQAIARDSVSELDKLIDYYGFTNLFPNVDAINDLLGQISEKDVSAIRPYLFLLVPENKLDQYLHQIEDLNHYLSVYFNEERVGQLRVALKTFEFVNAKTLATFLSASPAATHDEERDSIFKYAPFGEKRSSMFPNAAAIEEYVAAFKPEQQDEQRAFLLDYLSRVMIERPDDYFTSLSSLMDCLKSAENIVSSVVDRHTVFVAILKNMSLEKAKTLFANDAQLRAFFKNVSQQDQLKEITLIFNKVGIEHIFPTYDSLMKSLEETQNQNAKNGNSMRQAMWEFLIPQFKKPEDYMTKRHELFNYLALKKPSTWQDEIKKMGEKKFFALMFESPKLYERYENLIDKLKKNENVPTLEALLIEIKAEWMTIRDNIHYQDEKASALNSIAIYCLYDQYEKIAMMNKEVASAKSLNSNSLVQKASGMATAVMSTGLWAVGATNQAAKVDGTASFIKDELCRAQKIYLVKQVEERAINQALNTEKPLSFATFDEFLKNGFEPRSSDSSLMNVEKIKNDHANTKQKMEDLKYDKELGKLIKLQEDLASGEYFKAKDEHRHRGLSKVPVINT